ncbi:hypothetical protein BG004_000256 [Podila humilis]|nr:hypothetical protein BG004_000256 [Podila humilis]
MVQSSNKQVLYLEQPTDFPAPGKHLGVQTTTLDAQLEENEVLLRNLVVSIDPYLRERMIDEPDLFVSNYIIGKPFSSGGVSEVIQSRNPKFAVGDIVTGEVGWEEFTQVSAAALAEFNVIPGARDSKLPLSTYIGVLGMPGLTAYGSLKIIGQPKKGETIFISAASGAVGQVVGQIAKLQGLRVIGSAGTDDKVNYLINELKFDAAFNYKKGNILENLRSHAPKGIDIYFDNVAGETLEAAIEVLNLHGRVIACGHITSYNGQEPYGIRNLAHIVGKRLTIRGFIVFDFAEEVDSDFRRDVTQWLKNGKIVYKDDITEGLDAAPEAFVGMLHGKNFGKAVIKIADL